jgi:hypothetical protein
MNDIVLYLLMFIFLEFVIFIRAIIYNYKSDSSVMKDVIYCNIMILAAFVLYYIFKLF